VSLSSKAHMPLSLGAAEFLAAFAGRSCESAAVDAAKESFLVVLSLLVWRGGDAVVKSSQQRYSYMRAKSCPSVDIQHAPRFCRSMFTLTFVSSNGRHLKSFLYPPHSTLRFAHCWHPGFSSPHFSRLALHVTQPAKLPDQYMSGLHAFE
jgi:hypothetical protein